MSGCTNEESAKLFLVMPMLAVLGFDSANPFEVHPEHSADFSGDKRVDLAILENGTPIIALECKKLGADLAEERGPLRSYFNSVPSVKLGILTNGIVYEFFVDSAKPNAMDDEPFLTVDLEMVARCGMSDEVLDAICCMVKDAYEPEHLAEVAYVRLVKKRLRTLMADELANPSEDFCRYVLRAADVPSVRKEAIDRYYAPMVRAAISDVTKQASVSPIDRGRESGNDKGAHVSIDSRAATTERQLEVVAYVRRRLAFLIKDESLFAAIGRVHYKDYIGKMRVYYGRVQEGRLFDFIEGADGHDKYVFANPIGAIVTDNILDIDEALKSTFLARVKTLEVEAPAQASQPQSQPERMTA
jgi:hypothetical protein